MLKEIQAIIDKKLPLMSNLANTSAILNMLETINWCGFYVAKDNVLYLGPFQGDVACTVIPFNKGVCGTAAALKQSLIVDDVNQFKGHIACSSLSKSEIVVPILKNDEVVAVIDIDSPIYSRFNEEIKEELEAIAKVLSEVF